MSRKLQLTLAAVAVIVTKPALLLGNPDDPASSTDQTISELEPADQKEMGWQIVNDGVMGGLSKGNIEFADGVMKFWGILSLENNGGFSLAETRKLNLDLSNDLGILLRVRGDGRTFSIRLKSDARFRNMPVSFAGELPTTKGEWQQVKVPFSSFKGGFRGRNLPDAVLDTSQIQQLGIILGDKQAGPFQIEVDWIRTYGKGQGKND